MRFVICGSMTFVKEMLDIKKFLEDAGHSVMVPYNAEKFVSGEFAPETSAESTQKKIEGNLVQEYFLEIKSADAVIIANYDKRGVKNYIGGNSFLEAGFAHVLNKKLYFMNNIPEMIYSDELRAFRPIILDGDLRKIFL